MSLKRQLVYILIISPLFLLPAYLIYSYTGLVIINCSTGPMWRGISSAHKIHDRIKWIKKGGGSLPKSEAELKELYTDEYQKITTNAKSEYIYNSSTNTFYWFVRPSLYHVAVFSSNQDFGLYCLSKIFCLVPLPQYPPSFEGPWDKLPR